MTKTELVESVAQDLELSKANAQIALESVLARITAGLIRDAKVQIQGFGTFHAKMRKERMGRNPQTREPMLIPARKTVTFKPGAALKGRV